MLGTITNNHIQPSCAKKDIAFKGGINRRVTRCLNMSEDGMHRLVSAYSHTNGIVGHFPSDMVKVLRASNASGKLGERIKRFQTGFTEAADILKDTAKIAKAIQTPTVIWVTFSITIVTCLFIIF